MPYTDQPHPEPQARHLGRLGYLAYARHTGGLTHDGRPIPQWENLGETIQDAWAAAAEAIADAQASLPAPPPVLMPAPPQRPSVGHIVLVPMDPTKNNGATQAPAVITRVWSAETVNARVLSDTNHGDVEWRTSITYADTLDGVLHRWTWPPRI